MTPREKIDTAVAYLKSRKVSDSTAAPPVWRLCWRVGFLLPPPHFLGFFALALLTGIPFGIGMNLLMVAFFMVQGTAPDWPMVATGVGGSVFFGAALATYYRWSARRLGLPSWSEFDPEAGGADDTW